MHNIYKIQRVGFFKMDDAKIIETYKVLYKKYICSIHKYDNGYFDIQEIKTGDKNFRYDKKINTNIKQRKIQDDLTEKYNTASIITVGSTSNMKTFIHWSYVKIFFDICEFDHSRLEEFLDVKEESKVISLGYKKHPPESRGYVYCMSHPLFDGVYKIGCTRNTPHGRAKQLSGTGHYINFKVEFAKFVSDHEEIESLLHTLFIKYRVNKNREFFKVSLEKINDIFDMLEGDDYIHESD